MLIRKILFTGSIALLLTSCMSEKVDLSEQKLDGQWDIIQAFRDGKETKTLTDGFFEFNEGMKFRTNILNDPRPYTYELSGNRIKVESDPIVNYTVLNMLSDTLIMKTEIQKLGFKFISVKSQQYESTQE